MLPYPDKIHEFEINYLGAVFLCKSHYFLRGHNFLLKFSKCVLNANQQRVGKLLAKARASHAASTLSLLSKAFHEAPIPFLKPIRGFRAPDKSTLYPEGCGARQGIRCKPSLRK
jgi:hypothetical protein